MLATGLFFNPLSLFKPTRSGAWAVEDLDQVPDAVGRCVTKVKVNSTETTNEDGETITKSYFELEFMDKTKLLDLAMKHFGLQGTTKIEHTGNVGLDLGLSGGLNGLLMEVEQNRSSQVIDGEVVRKKLESSNGN